MADPERTQPRERASDVVDSIYRARGQWGMTSAGSAHGLEDELGSLITAGIWTEKLRDMTERFATSFSPIRAERFLQTIRQRIVYPKEYRFPFVPESAPNEEEIDLLYDSALNAYRRCGLIVGDYFLYSYNAVLKLGKTPGEFLELVEAAHQEAGAYTTSKYAYHLPEVMEAGGDAYTFRSTASFVRKKGSAKLAGKFLQLGVAMAQQSETAMIEYADIAVDNLTTLGANITQWSLPAFVHLNGELEYKPERTYKDISTVKDEYGEKAAGWFAFGLSRIAQALYDKNHDVRPGALEFYKENSPENIENVTNFEDTFKTVLKKMGLGAAIFYVRTVDPSSPLEYAGKMNDLRERIGKTIFDKLLWVITKASTERSRKSRRLLTKGARQMLGEFGDLFDANTKEELLSILNYTMGGTKGNKYALSGFLDPREHIAGETDGDYYAERYVDDDLEEELI